MGNRTFTLDAETNVTTYTYDSLYRLTAVTNAEQETTTTEYDALGNRTQVIDPQLLITNYQYDALNRLRFTTLNYDPSGPTNFETNVTSEVIYDRLGRTAERIDGRGNPTVTQYDDLGRTRFVTDANGNTSETIYDGLGNRRFVINAETEQTEFRYDGVNRLVKVIDDLGNETDYVYNKAGERTAMIDAETIETRYDYDALGRLTEVIENYEDGIFQITITDQDVRTQYGYDRVGNREVITNARGYTTTYRYDALNRRTHAIDALGNTTRTGYDRVGNRTVITDANNVVTIFDYDDVYRLTSIDYSDATPDVTFTYDQVGNRQTMTDGTGTTSYGYDDLYRLDSVNDGAGLQVGYQYDEVGNRTGLTYPDGKTVTYHYDAADRLDFITSSWDSGQFDYTYDDADRLTDFSRPNGVDSSIIYDDAGRPVELTHQTATETLASYSHTLDKVGNRQAITETLLTLQAIPAGTFLESGGQVVLEAEHFSDRTSSDSHEWLLKTSQSGYTGTSYLQALPDIDLLISTAAITNSPAVNYPIQFTTPGTYTVWSRTNAPNAAGDSLYIDLAGQLVSVTGGAPNEWDWANQQTPGGDPATLSITNGGLYTLTTSMREDGLRLDRLLLTTDPTTIPSGIGPAETSRQLSDTVVTEPLTRTIVYTYDNLHRLTQADYSTGEQFAYEYDPLGNQTTITETHSTGSGQVLDATIVTTYTYNAANHLVTARADDDGITWYYTHDNNGNLLRQTPGGTTATEGETRYSYDAANRLIEVELLTGGSYTTLSTAIYNGDGERMSLTTYALGTPQTVSYVMGADSRLLIADDGSQETLYLYGTTLFAEYDGAWRYPLRDSSASVRQSTDGSGAVISAQSYKPFGETLQETGAYESAFGFLGAQVDRVSGLLYANGRYYDPVTGRYLTPNHGQTNPYTPVQGPGLWLLLPLIGVVFAWKGRKGGPWRVLLLVIVIGVSGVVVSCGGAIPDRSQLGSTPPSIPSPQPTTPGTPAPIQPDQTPPPSSGATPVLPPTPCPIEDHTDTPLPNSTIILDNGRTTFITDSDVVFIGIVEVEIIDSIPVWFARGTSTIQVSKITIKINAWGAGGCDVKNSNCNAGDYRRKDWFPRSGQVGEKFNTNEYEDELPSAAGAGAIIAQFGFWIENQLINIYASNDKQWSSFNCWKYGPGDSGCPQ